MRAPPQAPLFLWELFQQLRRRRFLLGLGDYKALHTALRKGFGWLSRQALCELCVALWAKTAPEAETVRTLFAQLEPQSLPDWELPRTAAQIVVRSSPEHRTGSREGIEEEVQSDSTEKSSLPVVIQPYRSSGIGAISLNGIPVSSRRFAFLRQFPLTQRDVAQAWRRLRRPIRFGPRTELDVDATLNTRARSGVAIPPVLVPRRRNTARLLLLVDRKGSMTPYHRFIEEVTSAIRSAGGLEQASVYYFHDVPAEGADTMVLHALEGQFFPRLDSILPEVEPLIEGDLYTDPALTELIPLKQVLSDHLQGMSTVLISDAGAARGGYDVVRLLNTVAFLKGLRDYTPHYAWLNPVPPEQWVHTTAAQIARHAPIFALDRRGIYDAVNVLRGQPYRLERPL